MAEAEGVTRQTLISWGVEPVARIGRNVYYSPGDVLNNRMEHKVLGSNSVMAEINPARAEYAMQRIAELEAQIDASG